MAFLNSLMLFGAAATAIPILLELLNKQKIQKVPWAAMRFLKISHTKNRKRLRIEDLLLLLIRCLILLLLALALARPMLENSGVLGMGARQSILVVDNSYSMQLSDGIATRLDLARKAAEETVDALPAGSSAAVILATDRADPVVPLPTQDLSLVRRSLRNFAPSDAGTDLASALQAVVRLTDSEPTAPWEINIVTDGQAAGWRGFPAILGTLGDLANRYAVNLILVGEGIEPNLAITRFAPDNNLRSVGVPMRFEVEVTNYGANAATNVIVSLNLDDEPPLNQVVIDEIPPGTSRSATISAQFDQAGHHTATARLETDRLSPDNSRTVALRLLETVFVLIVEPRDTLAGPTGQRNGFFLQNALAPIPPELRERWFIQFDSVSPGEVNAINLGRSDLVVLAGIERLPEPALRQLAGWVERGGSLLVFPGPQTDASWFNQSFYEERGMFAGAWRPQEAEVPSVRFLDAEALDHPVVSIFRGRDAGSLDTANFFNYFDIEQGDWPVPEERLDLHPDWSLAGAPSPIIRYSRSTSAAVERSWGRGKVVQFSSTADTEWNDFPLRAVYLPFLHRLVGYLLESKSAVLNHGVARPIEFPVDERAAGAEVRVEYLPDPDVYREFTTAEFSGDRVAFALDGLPRGGPYRVEVLSDPPIEYKISAQPDVGESRLERISADQQAQLGEMVQVFRWQPGVNLAREMTQQRLGAELWYPLALTVLLLAILETILARRFSRPR